MAKKKVICDSDVMIDYWDNRNIRHDATKFILENTIGLDNIILSAITKFELIAGALNKSDMERLNTKLVPYFIAALDERITDEALELQQKYFLSHSLSLPDCLIAATSIVTGFELFTYNFKDFKFISQLTLYK